MTDKKTILITMYGGLKDFFEPQVTIQINRMGYLSDILNYLVDLKPEAKELMGKCAVAVNGAITKENLAIDHFQNIVILPPYSGG